MFCRNQCIVIARFDCKEKMKKKCPSAQMSSGDISMKFHGQRDNQPLSKANTPTPQEPYSFLSLFLTLPISFKSSKQNPTEIITSPSPFPPHEHRMSTLSKC